MSYIIMYYYTADSTSQPRYSQGEIMLHIKQKDLDVTKNYKVKAIEFEYVKLYDRSVWVEFDVEMVQKSDAFQIVLSLKRPDDDWHTIIHMDDYLPKEFVPEFLITSTLSLDENYGFARAIGVALIKLNKVAVALTLEKGENDEPSEIIAYVTIESPSGHTKFRTEGRIKEKAAKRHLARKSNDLN